METVIATHPAHADLCRNRLADRTAQARRLSYRLERGTRIQKILIFGIIGFAVFDPTVAFILVPFFILQVPAVIVINRLRRQIDRANRATEFYRHAVARISDRWIGDGNSGEQYLGDNEVFADDLDLFGRGSLFQFLCATQTSIGDNTLAAWLTQPACTDEIRERQSAVRELSNKLDLREQLAVLELDQSTFQPHALIEWTRAPELLHDPGTRAAGFVLAVAVAGVVLSLLTGLGLNNWVAMGVVFVELGFFALFRSRIRPITSHHKCAIATLSYLSRVWTVLQNASFESPRLGNMRLKIAAGAMVPPRVVCAVYRWISELPLLLLLVCQLVPRLDRRRRDLATPVEEGLQGLGELEALSSLGQYAFLRPDATFPALAESEKCFDAVGLAHPLVRAEERIENDLRLSDGLQLILVSGSNMSGKSTMLRTVGINAVLALCGAPVCARQLRLSAFSIGTAMRFQDSLENGTSHFYAVIARLRKLMSLQDGPRPLLFLIDEILQGTNSRDRIRGAEAVVRKLIERGGVGLVTTHDLELTRIVDSLGGRAANFHFADSLQDGEIHFDYKMRSGVVETSNALALMRKLGLVD